MQVGPQRNAPNKDKRDLIQLRRDHHLYLLQTVNQALQVRARCLIPWLKEWQSRLTQTFSVPLIAHEHLAQCSAHRVPECDLIR